MSDGEGVGWVPLEYPGMVNPSVIDRLMSGTTGIVAESGTVMVSGAGLEPTDDGLEPGDDVRVRMKNGDVYARPVAGLKRKQRTRKERRELKRRARERLKDWKERRAREFWEQYAIPFEWDVAIKGRRSGLLRGSNGNGRRSDTVNHLYVREPFSEGRLSRPEDCYLCDTEGDDAAQFQFDGERQVNSGGEEYRPRVTCQRCLDLMDRWKVETDGGKDKEPHPDERCMSVSDAISEYEPVPLDRTGTGGLSKDMVVDIILSLAGSSPFEDGTRPMKTHSASVNVHLAPDVDVETIARAVDAFDRLNLITHAKEDGRFSDGWNVRTLTVHRKRFTEDRYPERSPWWDAAGMEPEVVRDD